MIAFLLLDRFGPMEGDWGLDEGQRIAESYFWGLATRGEFSHPDWFRKIAIRSHPPVNKYLFGMAIQLHGKRLPPDLKLAEAYDEGATPDAVPSAFEPTYRPMRRPARRAALACNVGTALIVTVLVARWCGILLALLAAALFARHYLYVMLLFDARSDAVQTLTATATAIPLWFSWRAHPHSWRPFVLSAGVGGLAALSFQTRVSGIIALMAALVVYVVLWLRSRSAQPLGQAAVAIGTFVALSTVINPYYWGVPSQAADIPAEYGQMQPLLFRIVRNYWLQYQDLRTLLGWQEARWHLSTLEARIRFVGSVMFSGVAGILIATGMAAAVVIVLMRRRQLPEHLAFAATWGGAILVIFTAWIPLRWDPYVLIVFPAAVLVASTGWGGLVQIVRESKQASALSSRPGE